MFEGKFKTPKTIFDVLKQYGVESKSKSDYVQLDHQYFSTIDTPNKAYILGFLLADGWVDLKKGTVAIQLQKRDAYIVEAIKEEWRSDVSILITKAVEGIFPDGKIRTKGVQHRILVHSRKMLASLKPLGMGVKKAQRSILPLVGKFQGDLLRGIFDGDGTAYLHSGGKHICIRFAGNMFIPAQISLFLHAKLDVKQAFTRAPGNYSTVEWTVQDEVATITQYLYAHTPESLFLRRKREILADFLD